MTDLSNQKRMAADIIGCGENRVWIDPGAQSDVAEAITREDVRELVRTGLIREKQKKGVSRGRARERDQKRAYGHGKGPGKRKGKAGARNDSKDEWQSKIRAQRRELKRLREQGEITPSEYRELYRRAKGGEFRSVGYLRSHVEGDTEGGD
ncbi:MAG: 50S ribosomal protein L19e [Halobacteriota archaeon]